MNILYKRAWFVCLSVYVILIFVGWLFKRTVTDMQSALVSYLLTFYSYFELFFRDLNIIKRIKFYGILPFKIQ
jgi:hypothetical protein